MKTCPKCNEEYPDGQKFCPQDGTGLVEKETGQSAMTGGKILAGGDVTQHVNHHMETKVYNQDETKQMIARLVANGR